MLSRPDKGGLSIQNLAILTYRRCWILLMKYQQTESSGVLQKCMIKYSLCLERKVALLELLAPFYRWWNWGSQRLSDLPRSRYKMTNSELNPSGPDSKIILFLWGRGQWRWELGRKAPGTNKIPQFFPTFPHPPHPQFGSGKVPFLSQVTSFGFPFPSVFHFLPVPGFLLSWSPFCVLIAPCLFAHQFCGDKSATYWPPMCTWLSRKSVEWS